MDFSLSNNLLARAFLQQVGGSEGSLMVLPLLSQGEVPNLKNVTSIPIWSCIGLSAGMRVQSVLRGPKKQLISLFHGKIQHLQWILARLHWPKQKNPINFIKLTIDVSLTFGMVQAKWPKTKIYNL